MAYSSGFMHFRVTIARRLAAETGSYGRDSAGIKFAKIGTFWAAVDYKRGIREMREGALDGYDFIMIRMRWVEEVERECLVRYDGRWYQIESCHRDYQENTIQITAREMANSTVDLYELRPLTADDAPLMEQGGQQMAVRVKIV